MNTEKINAAAWQLYPNEPNIVWGSIERTAFIAGITYAAANPDVIGCVKVEDALAFAEWVQENDWDNNIMRWTTWVICTSYPVYQTTTELFQYWFENIKQ
jgi:hypothetical protein